MQRLEIIKGCLVLSLKLGDIDFTWNFFDKYYMPLLEIKDFNAVTDNNSTFDQPVKIKQELYEKHVEMSKLWLYYVRIITLFVKKQQKTILNFSLDS